MPKFSVKKPFTILVSVILVLVLGVVSILNMTTDLLPSLSLPYLVVVTTYPGASPEKVEADLTALLEATLGTVNGVENVTSTSSENYSMVMLEFAEDTNMDSAMVKASTALNQLADSLPEMAGTPMLIEVSPDMMATQYVGVEVDGMDIYELSDYVESEIIPELERLDGVASVSATGLVERTVEVTLRQDKIDEVNDKLLVKVSSRLDEAKQELEKAERELNSGAAGIADGKAQLAAGEAQMAQGKAELQTRKENLTDSLREAIAAINAQIPGLEQQISDLEGKIRQTEDKIGGLQSQEIKVNLPAVEITLDEQLLSQTRDILRETLGEDYDEAAMPANLEDALANDGAKMKAMQAAITEADARLTALSEEALGGETAEDLNQQVTALEQRIAELEGKEERTPEEETELEAAKLQRAALQQRLDTVQSCQQKQTILATAAAALANARTLLDAQNSAQDAANQEVEKLEQQLNAELAKLSAELDGMRSQLGNLKAMLAQLNEQRGKLETVLEGLIANPLDTSLADMASQLLFSGLDAQLGLGEFQLQSAKTQLQSGEAQIESGREQIKTAWEEYENARKEALENANLDQLLNMQTLAQMIGAQNFEMPAGYIQDGDTRYMLKVGGQYETVEDLGGTLLCSIDGIGDVRLRDVADIEVTDNADEAYAKLDGGQMVLLSVFKGSTASTSEVSNACNARARELMAARPGLQMTAIMDQGDYIRMIVESVVSNLLWGAALAILVLAIFLKDVRPTAVVAISIPLSVLFAVVLMYFSKISLNMISLSGLALGVGMLVDNSIVVIENIYRLRSRGVPAPRASVQGARQVSGAIISSTATTICVFLPLLFTDGMVRQLMSDMGLTIAYALIASLIVALTVVPCAGSTVLKKAADKPHPWFDRMLAGYEKLLRYCLRVKVVPLGISGALLVFCIWQVVRSGIVLMPEMASNQMSATVTLPEETEADAAFATADKVLDVMAGVDGVETVGMMTSGSLGGLMGGMGGGQVSLTEYTAYLILTEDGAQDQARITEEILAGTAGLDCTVELAGGSSMDMSALTGSGVEVEITGRDLDTMLAVSEEVEELMAGVPGITEISNGQEEGDPVLRVAVDRDKAMRCGLTVAQIYAELAQALTTETTSTSLTVGQDTYTVEIIDTTRLPDAKTIFDHEFTTTATDENGQQTKEVHTLGEFASRQTAPGVTSIERVNQVRVLSVTSATAPGYNTTLLGRELQTRLDTLEVPEGCTVSLAGESTQVNEMLVQMAGMLALALLLIYFVMVAQFQSLLSPFIVLFTVPLAFTGGMLGLLLTGEPLSMLALMGFLVLMGVIVNNGIVFVDYANQLRIGGLKRRDALVATGKTRMRPILMTTLTTVLSMMTMIFSKGMGSEMGRGMAIVVVGGLLYATLMTLFIVPVMYDLLFKKKPVNVDVGDDGMDDLPDDAAEFLSAQRREEEDFTVELPTLKEGSHAE